MGQGAGAASVEYLVHSPMIRSQYQIMAMTVDGGGDDDYNGFGQILLD